MDLHIERPELNATTPEENIATVDTWIADTSDKLNIALENLKSATAQTSTTTSASQSKNLVGLVPYLGDYKADAVQVIYKD